MGVRSGRRLFLHRWPETVGAQLLIVDPGHDDAGLADGMAGRGVHVTWVSSTLDALVELGRLDPHTVVVSPDAPGMPVDEFVATVSRHGTLCAVLAPPYDVERLWDLVSHSARSLEDHVTVSFGPIELDSSAYRVLIRGERIADLPLKEFELLRALMLKAPGIVTDDELREAMWGSEERRPSGNTIAMHVTRLRHRLDGAADIRRIRGRGYSLAD
ncbi:winged helix-turn-helix transcriptional regulator [Nocardioides humilatus]|uniref:Winged helix-turn-helix transcriptional regulator n=1 Tax=Nocardioides humilatus TaxID=2607660 RepID=A0A5B1LPK9_9ACTN|nr:winged helix-turn-helix domain-containing protein [Nocardioides humilatus]KAA1421497.1 winged helix-turn-helix transcriptional regulator [Nocardioides humilatus]